MKKVISANLPLIEALKELSPESSNTTLRSWIKEGRVLVNGEVVKQTNAQVHQGQEVSLGAKPKFVKNFGLRIYFEDAHIVVIEKPAGLLSVATNFETGKTAHALLKEHYKPKKVYPVHRLDQETSGVMVFAVSEKAREGLKIIFEKHEIERVYFAIVEGQLSSLNGVWKSYLVEDASYRVRSTDDKEEGKLAITHYQVLSSTRKYSTLKLQLETGKKNQIRVHCQDAGHPIVGDSKYGAVTDPLKRLCLHAHILAFTHPVTKQKLRFESPLPDNFQKLM